MEVKSKSDIIVDKTVAISTWARSCKTLVQLKTVEDFFNKLCNQSYGTSNARITYNLGVAQGFILSKKMELSN